MRMVPLNPEKQGSEEMPQSEKAENADTKTQKMRLTGFQKNPRAHKNKIGTPPPPKTQNTPPPRTRNFMGMGFSCRKNAFFQAPIKLAQPFPAPELRARDFMDTRTFLRLYCDWLWVTPTILRDEGGGSKLVVAPLASHEEQRQGTRSHPSVAGTRSHGSGVGTRSNASPVPSNNHPSRLWALLWWLLSRRKLKVDGGKKGTTKKNQKFSRQFATNLTII